MKTLGLKRTLIFIVLSASVAVAYQVPFLRYTFYDQMVSALALNDTQMGFLASALAFTNIIVYPLSGFLADRFSMRNLIAITMLTHAIATIVFANTTNYAILIAIHLVYGFFGVATLWSAYLTGIRMLGDESMQSKLYGSSEATRGVIQTICGFIYMGLMAAAANYTQGFYNVMILGTIFFVILFILSLVILPKGRPDELREKSETAETITYTLKDILTTKGVWITVIVIISAFTSWCLGNGYLTTYTVRVLGLSAETASTLGSIRSYIIVVLAGIFGGWFLDKFSYKGKGFFVLFIATIATVLGIMLTSKVVPICIVITMVMAFVVNIMKSTYWSIMGQAGIPVKMTAVATGIISFIVFIPDFVVPIISGYWLDQATAAGNVEVGFNKMFILLIVTSCIGLIGSMILTKQTKKLEEQGLSIE